MAAWIADLKAKGYDFEGRHDVYRPVAGYPGAEGRGHSFAPPIFTAADSETSFMADEILKWLSVRRDAGLVPAWRLPAAASAGDRARAL